MCVCTCACARAPACLCRPLMDFHVCELKCPPDPPSHLLRRRPREAVGLQVMRGMSVQMVLSLEYGKHGPVSTGPHLSSLATLPVTGLCLPFCPVPLSQGAWRCLKLLFGADNVCHSTSVEDTGLKAIRNLGCFPLSAESVRSEGLLCLEQADE